MTKLHMDFETFSEGLGSTRSGVYLPVTRSIQAPRSWRAATQFRRRNFGYADVGIPFKLMPAREQAFWPK